jgi:sulfur carrier protein
VRVELNGAEREVRDGASVAELVRATGAPAAARGVAVALDGEVVPRSAWDDTTVAEGQRVEVLEAMQGG